MADALLQIVLQNLSSLIQNEIGLLCGVNKEMEKLKSNFSTIQAVLEDAEQKQHLREGKAIKDWLRKLKYTAHEVDDILDDCETEANRLKSKSRKKVCLASLTCSYPIGNILFRRRIGNRMREVIERLDEIAKERRRFHLREADMEKRVRFSEIRQTGSILTEPQVYGRNEDKEKIVEVLINHASDCEDLLVYPIIGMGGLGKTTLAQLIINDERVASHFEARIWVCVSEDFDVKRVLKEITESATKSACDVLELDPLQRRLQDLLKHKRYLLVLDDVWNENQEKWESLKGVLKECKSRGASIITTTRLEKVASIMGTHLSHRLVGLSDDDCWLLFKQRAFGSEREEHPNLVTIGKGIVKKCGGVPLAAKALGSLMRFKREEKDWVFVKNSKIWNLPQDKETSILPALRLSYYNLPLELRRCFAYCAVYEKDTNIEKDDLIHLWIANGFISSTNENMDMEDIGNEIWNELYWRSFFQDVWKYEYGGIRTFKMHDLVHDLAQSVMEEECQIVEVERPISISSKRVRHLNLIAHSRPLTAIPNELQNIGSVRTLLYTEKQDNERTNSSEFSIFENHGALRAFSGWGRSVTMVASSIGSLKHLRYLRLFGKHITRLPDSICSLWNLQTLNVSDCYNLEKLPKKMTCLRNLRHLLMYGCNSIIETPPFISELTCLKTLSQFIVENTRGCGLDELRCLNHLGRSLHIKNLERVINWMDGKEATLDAKQNLHCLTLSWDTNSNSNEEYDSQENVEQLLQGLQPSSNLKKLRIYGFKGTQFPLWMSDYSNLKSIVEMKLSNCKNSLQLPPFHQLPSLRILSLSEMNCVEYIINDENDYEVKGSDNVVRGFPCLGKLYIKSLPNLRGLSRVEEGRGSLFPNLCKLEIDKCPKLTTWPSYLSALEELVILRDEEITSSLDSLGNLISLRTLKIWDCPKLASIPANFQSLAKLQNLYIKGSPQLGVRCKERGDDWDKIAHVQYVTIR